MENIIRIVFVFGLCLMLVNAFGQNVVLKGQITNGNKTIEKATVNLKTISHSRRTDTAGKFVFFNLDTGKHILIVSAVGYKTQTLKFNLLADSVLNISLIEQNEDLNELVVTGTFKEVNRLQSPVPVEVYSAKFFQKNPTPTLFDALQNINGVRPQLNCSICNTGDIHINGLEGPYTMVMLDGMPIVSSLSTVYGLSGIPNSLVERVEVVKGPASSLYGSEAIGGLINIITKEVAKAPVFTADLMTTTYLENNVDVGFKAEIAKKVQVLTGLNYFRYNQLVDENRDGFTDVTLQDRVSVFQKWNISRKSNRLFTLVGRFLYEDRWGGEMNWNKGFRGGDAIYGESIFTKRIEMLGKYELPVSEKMFFSFSLTKHNQDSRYGTTSFIAQQNISFSQLTWDKKVSNHDLLFGAALRYTFYDDNTPATSNLIDNNAPEKIILPGFFAQDEIKIAKKQTLLLGMRYDRNSLHGNIFTPRLAYKYNIDAQCVIRFNAGTGFRVVNVFTEDHAALTGARNVVMEDNLEPEKSYNMSLNFLTRAFTAQAHTITFDVSAFYTYFKNRIVADYETNVNEINYGNLNGFASSKGVNANIDATLNYGLKINAGITLQDISLNENGLKSAQMLTEKWMGTWAVSYHITTLNLGIDYTGNIYGPMHLPLLGVNDPRLAKSPVWSIQNIQMLYKGFKNFEIYGGVKNLLNFKPTKNNPFLIARTNDPFDKDVVFDNNGNAMVTPNNPFGLTFDPSYIYAPNQGIRGFLGIRYSIK